MTDNPIGERVARMEGVIEPLKAMPERMSRLEEGHKSLCGSVERLRTSLSAGQAEVKEAIAELADKVEKNSTFRTQTLAIAGVVAAAVAFLGQLALKFLIPK